MPPDLKALVVASYNESLAPVYLYLVPLMAIGFVLLLFVKEKPLATSNEVPTGEPPAYAAERPDYTAEPEAPKAIGETS